MYRIYFDTRCLTICSSSDDFKNDPNAVAYYPKDDNDLKEITTLFDVDKKITNLYIPTEDMEKAYGIICSSMTEINAAGGLITNGRGEYLMIMRKGLWDLPKGKQEPGEDITVTAVREVEEECGVTAPKRGELICITNHTYHRDGQFVLKHTYWYDMTYDSPMKLTPQTEEEITQAVWVPKNEMGKCLENTYPSIKEVLKARGITSYR